MKWFSEFKIKVVENYGEERWRLVNKHLGSFYWKLGLADYHSKESLSILVQVMPINTKSTLYEAAKRIMSVAGGEEGAQKIVEAWFKSEAHIIAFAQALHSSCDILAKAIYQGLDLENNFKKRLGFRSQNLFTILDGMVSTNYAPNVSDAIDRLLQSREYKYLHAFVNQTKHHSLVNIRDSVSFEHGKHGLLLSDFEESDNKKKWPRKWADDFVTTDFEVIKANLENTGSKLAYFEKAT